MKTYNAAHLMFLLSGHSIDAALHCIGLRGLHASGNLKMQRQNPASLHRKPMMSWSKMGTNWKCSLRLTCQSIHIALPLDYLTIFSEGV